MTTTTTTDPHALPIAETEGRGDVYARQLRQHNSTVSMYAANPENVSGDERAVLDLVSERHAQLAPLYAAGAVGMGSV